MKKSLRILLAIIIIALALEADAQTSFLLQSQLPPMIHDDLAAINAWKPELKVLPPNLIADKESVPEYVDDLIKFARQFTGLRYRRGGKTPKGFDCSGFTGYVFRQFGIGLNADSRSQYRQGNSIDNEDMRPGDLVFFSGRAVSKTRVGHVGIVTSVDPENGTFKFIHSATSSGIIESASDEPYYRKRYIGARRVE